MTGAGGAEVAAGLDFPLVPARRYLGGGRQVRDRVIADCRGGNLPWTSHRFRCPASEGEVKAATTRRRRLLPR
jgi:hypothetical protein